MPSESRSHPAPRSYLVIGLVAATVLLYEIAVIRILSVVLWYHFAFVAISLALLGLSVPGVWFSLFPPRASRLPALLLLSGVAVPASVIVLVKSGEWLARTSADGALLGAPNTTVLTLCLVVAILVPMLCLGACVCLLLLGAPGREVGRVYAADLLGATVGAVLVVPLMTILPTPALVASCGALPLAAALLFSGAPRWIGLGLGILLAATLAWGEPFQLRFNKNYHEGGLDVLYERWTPTARLTVFSDVFWTGEADQAFGWGMGENYEPRDIEQHWIEQDGSAGTPITKMPRSLDELDYLDYDVTSLAYQLRPPERVCIIGAGGGRDILTAVRAGAEKIDAVELNPEIIHIATDVFGDYSGNVYELPNVTAHASEGRNFLTRTRDVFDLIQISLIDSWAATAAGAFSLSENYLYTVEAVRLYWNRITEGGMITISRWMSGSHQLESSRLALLAMEALRREGVAEPKDHLVVVQGGTVGTLLLSREPFRRKELARLARINQKRGFTTHWPPVSPRPENSVVEGVLTRGPGAFEKIGLDLSSPTDDRPFFFQMVNIVSGVDVNVLQRLSVNDRSVALLRYLVGLISLLTVVLFFVPFAFRGRTRRAPGFWRGSAYFAAIGIAFMLVEVPILQKLILYLGHPSFATTVVLTVILCGSGIGAGLASRVSLDRVHRVRFVLPIAIVALNLLLPWTTDATLGSGFPVRVLTCVGLLLPLGLLMGFALPLGMIRFSEQNKAWFWAMNGATSVLASVLSLALALIFGLSGVVWVGVAGYLIACLLLPRVTLDRPETP